VNGAQDGAIIVVAIVSMVILMYCVMNGTTILNIFNPEVGFFVLRSTSHGPISTFGERIHAALNGAQGEGVMMSYTAQSKSANSRAELASVVTGGAITAQPGEGATTAGTPAASDVK
jgi:hypothetical protein